MEIKIPVLSFTSIRGLNSCRGFNGGRERERGEGGRERRWWNRCNRTKMGGGGEGIGAAQGFMSRVILLLTVAYYGNFLKLSVASAENNANRKWIIIGL